MKVMYIRVSTVEQNEARQIEQSKEVGAEKIFIDKATGSNTDRKALKEMLSFVREGDTVIVSDISRIARNVKDLLTIVDKLTERGVEFRSLKENIDTTTPAGKFMLSVFGALYELELNNIRTRQAEGIAIAKAQGKYKGRKRKEIDPEEFKRLCQEWREGKRTAKSIMDHFSISSQTFYRRVNEANL